MFSVGTQAREWIAKHCPIPTPERPHNPGAVGFQSVVPRCHHQHHHPRTTQLKLLGWVQQSVIASPPENACLSVRITALEHPKCRIFAVKEKKLNLREKQGNQVRNRFLKLSWGLAFLEKAGLSDEEGRDRDIRSAGSDAEGNVSTYSGVSGV